jgi:hypothetical protein
MAAERTRNFPSRSLAAMRFQQAFVLLDSTASSLVRHCGHAPLPREYSAMERRAIDQT